MNIMITGASGLLGRQVMAAFRDLSPVGIAFSREGAGLQRLDLTDAPAVDAFVRQLAPSVIIHAAAHRRPDVCEGNPAGTEQLNVAGTRQLAELARELNAWMLYLSTDYVFDGSRPPYEVDAQPKPLNNYGRSKLAGEQIMREILPSGAILRVPILYGPIEELAESAVTVTFEALRQGTRRFDHWAIRYPTHTADVAAAIRRLSDRHASHGDVTGTFHFSGSEALTKYEIARIMGEMAGIDGAGITPDSNPSPGAPRPKDCRLDCSRIENLIAPTRRPFKAAIAQALAGYF